jgi:hypothetical protein
MKTDMLISKYREIHETCRADSDLRRFIVFEPQDQSGWGNRLRGLTLCLLFSLATRRILVVHDFLIEEHFLAPEGCSWKYRDWEEALGSSRNETQVMDLHLSPSDWNEEEWRSYANESMESLYSAKIVVLRQSVGFFDQLIANPYYKDLWESLELDTRSKISWLGSLTQAFLNRPTPKLENRHNNFIRKISLDMNRPVAIVQFRTFYDIGAPQKNLVIYFIEEVRRELAKRESQDIQIFIATDDLEATRSISQSLSDMGTVIVSPTKVVHTGSLHNGWELVLEKILAKLFHRSCSFFDFWAWLPEYWRPRPHTAVLAEWMFYGRAEAAYSTFTSYMVYAMARSGNKAPLFRFDPDTRRLEKMSNEKYYF